VEEADRRRNSQEVIEQAEAIIYTDSFWRRFGPQDAGVPGQGIVLNECGSWARRWALIGAADWGRQGLHQEHFDTSSVTDPPQLRSQNRYLPTPRLDENNGRVRE